MDVYRVKTGSILPLGKQGENLAKQIQFDLSRWISNFGPGTVQLLHQRSGDEAPYPVAVEREGNLAVWTVTNADTAAAGTGRAELQYYVGDALAKSETWMTKVLPALGDAGETPPEAQQGWVDQVLQAGAAAAEAADRAEEAAVRQPYPNAETGTWWVWNAESGAYEDTGISYGTGGSGGGVTDHEKLTGRDKADQHPMSAITGLEDALAGKQPTGTYLTEETDPTVPDWAKEPTKPGYTASEVGADPSGTASSQVSAHNTGADTHSDIRLLIQGLTERLNALADSDDTTLDQLSEVVAYIKSNRSLIEDITTSKVSVADIIDNLTTNAANKPLSAAQGVALKALIDAITIPTALPNPNALTFTGAVTGRYDGSAPLEVEIPSGGGGGNPLYVKGGTTLAEGTIPSGLAQYTFTDTGLKLYEVLQEWKIFFIQVYCAGEVNNINIFTYQNNSQPFYNPGKDCNYALSIFEGVTKDSAKFMFFSAGVGNYWDVYSPTGTISSHHMNPAPTLSIKHIPPDTGLYLRNYSKDTGHDYLWKVTGLVKWG